MSRPTIILTFYGFIVKLDGVAGVWYTIGRTPPHGGWGMRGGGMDAATKKQVINRLRSIAGHVRGIEHMVEEDEYCIDVIKQAIAVQRALERVNGIILESHLETCVTTAIRGEEAEERERVIGEILEVFETASSL
jgi:DNA-binding FrmR family transcriptional regulator